MMLYVKITFIQNDGGLLLQNKIADMNSVILVKAHEH